jgi:acetyltransferase-like isoleucine patch superfamily enzyme
MSHTPDNAGDAVSKEVAQRWYIPELPKPPEGWLLLSEELILRVLQHKRESTEPVDRSAGWRFKAGLVRAILAVVQAVVMFFSYIPLVSMWVNKTVTFWPRGPLGCFLRGAYWKTKLRRLGVDTLIDRGVDIWGARNVEIGAGCHIDTYVRLAAGESKFGQHGDLVIGDYTHIGTRVNIAGRGGVKIGKMVSMQAGVHVYSASNALMNPREPGRLISFAHTAPPGEQYVIEGPVEIGDYASIGFNVLIQPNVRIGRACVVHPFAQVATSFPDFANVIGPGPAKQNGWRRPFRPDPRSPAGMHAAAQAAPPPATPSAG